MSLINYKSSLSNYRREIKPKPTETTNPPPVEFGNYTPVTNALGAYQDDIYGFSTKNLETFDRKAVNEKFTTDSILEKESIYDNDNISKKDLTISNVVNSTQEPFTGIEKQGNNEESPIDVIQSPKKLDKSTQAKTINPVNQDDKITPLTSKFELGEKIKRFKSKNLEKINSLYDTSEIINQTNPRGRYETEKESIYGFNSANKPEINAFDNKFNTGFKINNKGGFTNSALNYSWEGGRDNAPAVSGFKTFTKLGVTEFDKNSLPGIKQTDYFSNKYNKNFVVKQKETQFTNDALGFTTPIAVDYFKNEYSKNFTLNSKPLESSFTSTGLNYGLNNLQTVNFFDTNKTYTISGFVKKQTKLNTDFNSTALDWAFQGTTPATNFFDKNNRYTKTGFTIRQQVLNTTFTNTALDWGLNGQVLSTNYFDVNNQYTNTGFTVNKQLLVSDFTDTALDWGLKGQTPSTNYFDITNKYSNNGFTIKQKIYQTGFSDIALDYGLNGTFRNVNFFDLNNLYTNSGFVIKQKIYETDFNKSALDWGLNGNLLSTNFFDLNNVYTNSGFVIKQRIYETDFKASALDWGLKGKLLSTNFFDLNKSYTKKGFVINQKKYQTDFNVNALDWGLKGKLLSTNFFDLNNLYTKSGFVIKQKTYETDFNKSALDWGLKRKNPTTDFFDKRKQFTVGGFTFKQKILNTDFNKIALDWGLKGTRPSTNFFDLKKSYTKKGFVIKQKIYESDFNASALDWGLQGGNPTTDFFDKRKQFTKSGFKFKQSTFTTDFNKIALDWGLKGTRPSTNFFDKNKAYTINGFVLKQPLFTTDFNLSALDWGLQGTNPTTDFFDQNKNYTINGFTFKQPLLTTDFNSSALDWGLQGTNPTTDFFDQNKNYTINGFTLNQPLFTTDFNASALDWGLQGTNPTTDFFDQSKTYTTNGFVFKQSLFTTDFNASALDWGLQGTNPTTDFFDQSKTYTTNGFVFKQSLFATDFNSSALDWGLQGTNPTTDFFDQNKTYTNNGFVFRQSFRTTDFNSSALNYSLLNVPPLENGQPSATVINRSGKTYGQVNFFDQTNQYTTKGFHVLATPFEATSYKTNSTRFFTVPASDFEIPRIGSPEYKLSAQLVKSPIFFNIGFEKANNNVYSELIRTRNYTSFLGDTATTRRVSSLLPSPLLPSLLDSQYEKYDLQAESTNTLQGLIPEINVGELIGKIESSLGLNNLPRINFTIPKLDVRQPYIIRGIQKSGQVENERWGFQGTYSDDTFIRGGNSVFERTANDVLRLLKWSSTIKGVLYITKQAGLELSNPITEASRGLIRGVLTGKKLYNPLSPLIAAATSPFGIYPANRRRALDTYQEMIQGRISNFEDDPIDSSRNAELAYDLDLLKDSTDELASSDYKTIVLDPDDTSAAGSIIGTLSGLGGPNSLYGLGFTAMRRNSVSIPIGAIQKYNTRAQYASALSISDGANRDELRSKRGGDRGIISLLQIAYLTFQGKRQVGVPPVTLFKTARTSEDGIFGNATLSEFGTLNFGLSGENSSIKYLRDVSPTGVGITILNRDLYSPHKYKNPFSYYREPNETGPVISELENLGVISRRQQGFYAPREIPTKKFFSFENSSLNINNSSIFDTAFKANIGPLEQSANDDYKVGKYKIDRLYSTLFLNATKYKTVSDISNLQLAGIDAYDTNDNLDLIYYIKNYKNPLNKIIEDYDSVGLNNRFVNINNRVNYNRITNLPKVYNPDSVKEYATLAYTDIPGKYVDADRIQVALTKIGERGSTPLTANKRFKERTVLNLNDRKFHDFRYKVHAFTQDIRNNIYTHPGGKVPFVSNPEIIKYRANNLENAVGFGKHGLAGVDRSNPVLSIAFGPSSAGRAKNVTNGVREINGYQYGGYHEFRGDRVNLVDFRHDKSTTDINEIYELGQNSAIPGTKDLIEFYVTGMNQKDKVIVFRASITEVNDNFNPSWETVKYLNRADPVYIYKGFERDVSIGFDVAITSRDELRSRWRSLNALAGFTAPEYINSSNSTLNGRMKAPLMKLTLGNLYRATPCIITSLNYTFDNTQVVWETAKLKRWVNGQEIEETITTNDLDDPAGCVALQLPKMIKVSMNLKIIGNYRPQSNGGASGYPDMGVFYQLYANDDSANDGQLPRKGGIYVNYFNRECTVMNLPPEQPKERVTEVREEAPKKPVEPPKEEVKLNKVETTPEEAPKKSEPDDQKPDNTPQPTVEESLEEAPKKNGGVTTKKKPRKQSSSGAKSPRADNAEFPSSVNNPRTPAGQVIPYP